MSIEEKLAFLEDMMELDAGELTEDMELDGIEEWDSLTKLSLMAACKKMNTKELSVEQIRKFKTVKDICDFLE